MEMTDPITLGEMVFVLFMIVAIYYLAKGEVDKDEDEPKG